MTVILRLNKHGLLPMIRVRAQCPTCLCLERSERNDKNYELIEYLNDVNREHAEVLVEQNINGKTDTSYIYGAEINGGFDRISLDRFDGSTGYYLYDARGSVSGITNEEGQVYQSYRYSVTGEITFGAPQYENEYTYNGESYNPNIQSQYLRARYYCVVTLPSSLVGIREAIKGNFDSKEMQRTATAGFYAGFVGQGIEYTQIISKADYQLSLLIVTQKGLNAAANPLTYVEYFRNFSPQEKLEAAKRTAKGAWNGEYDSALGRKTGAAILDYLLVAIGGALMKGENAACEVAESGTATINPNDIRFSQSSVNGASEIIDSMKAKGWDGDQIDVVRMPDGNLTTIANTRVLAARYAEIDVQANVHAFDEVLPQDLDLIEWRGN